MEQILLLARKKSVLLISHRLANITKADVIYAMEQGEVKECGTHKELLKKNGLYQKCGRHSKGWNAMEKVVWERMKKK